MAKQPKRWVYSPRKPKKPKVPDSTKAQITQQAQALIDDYFKPNFIREVEPDYQWNYIIDINGKWYRNYYYFISTYRCSSPNCITPTFESKFARMEYTAPNTFNLSFMRHTDKWAEMLYDLTLEDALKEIAQNQFFHP
ncbi:MAG: hypothetical protein AAF614_14225 [Chloroflexota bacterium]